MKTYAERLAVELDREWVTDADAERALDAVRECEASGKDPAESFGEPEDYAKTFPKSAKKRQRYQIPLHAGGVLAIAWFIGAIIFVKLKGIHLTTGLMVTGPPIIIMLVSMVIADILSRLRARRRVL